VLPCVKLHARRGGDIELMMGQEGPRLAVSPQLLDEGRLAATLQPQDRGRDDVGAFGALAWHAEMRQAAALKQSGWRATG